eukprot:1107790-Lingulodinium_polyedra.AAC.1
MPHTHLQAETQRVPRIRIQRVQVPPPGPDMRPRSRRPRQQPKIGRPEPELWASATPVGSTG